MLSVYQRMDYSYFVESWRDKSQLSLIVSFFSGDRLYGYAWIIRTIQF